MDESCERNSAAPSLSEAESSSDDEDDRSLDPALDDGGIYSKYIDDDEDEVNSSRISVSLMRQNLTRPSEVDDIHFVADDVVRRTHVPTLVRSYAIELLYQCINKFLKN